MAQLIASVHALYPMRRPSSLGDPGGAADDSSDDTSGDSSSGDSGDSSGGDTLYSGGYTDPGDNSQTTLTQDPSGDGASSAVVGGTPAGVPVYGGTPTGPATPGYPVTPSTPTAPAASIKGSAWMYILGACAIVGATGAVVYFASGSHKAGRRRSSPRRRRARRR
jgi:hypothetical protein